MFEDIEYILPNGEIVLVPSDQTLNFLRDFPGSKLNKPEEQKIDIYKQFDQLNDLTIKNQLDEIDNKFNDPDLFKETQTTKRVDLGRGIYSQPVLFKTKPYEKELNQYRQQIIGEGINANPTDEEVQDFARLNLAEIEKNKIKTKVSRDFINDLSDEDRKKLLSINVQKTNELTKQFDLDLEGKNLIDQQAHLEALDSVYTNSDEYKFIQGQIELRKDPSYKPDALTQEEADKANKALEYVLEKHQELETLNKKYNSDKETYFENRDELKDLSFEFDLLKRDYSLAKKSYQLFADRGVNMGLGGLDYFSSVVKGAYPMSELALDFDQYVDELQIQQRKNQQIRASELATDIQFEDAFDNLSNFGEFAVQELFSNAPIFLTLAATGGVASAAGLGSLGARIAAGATMSITSAGQQIGDMTYEEYLSKQDNFEYNDIVYSDTQKFLVSTGFGAAELFGAIPTFKIIQRGAKTMMSLGKEKILGSGIRKYISQNAWPGVISPTIQEGVGEGLTQLTQNALTDRPLLEGVDHAAFTGSFLGFGMSSAPVLAGAVATKFSNYNDYNLFRVNLNKIKVLDNAFLVETKGLDKRTKQYKKLKKELDAQKFQLTKENNEILDFVDKNVKNISTKAFDEYAKIVTDQELIRNQAKEVIDGELSNEQKKLKLDILKEQFDLLQGVRDQFRDKNNYGRRFSLLKATDKARYNEIQNKAALENKTAEDIYYEEEFDIASKKAETIAKSLKTNYNVFETTKEAQDYLNKIEASENVKKIERANGFFLKKPNNKNEVVVIKEKAINNLRAKTSFHEVAHALFADVLKVSPDQMLEIESVIKQWLGRTNSKMYFEMFGGAFASQAVQLDTKGKTLPEETVVSFIERVADGRIDLNARENRGLAGIFGKLINNVFTKNKGKKAEIDFEGEQDIINFIGGIATKFKDGTFGKEDIDAINKRKILRDQATTDDTKTELKPSEPTPEAKKASERVQRIYEEKGKDGIFEIATEFQPIIGKIVDTRRGVPGFDKETLEFELTYGKTGLISLLETYDGSVPLGAYINKILPLRFVAIADKILDSKFTVSLEEESVSAAAQTTTLQVSQEDVTAAEQEIETEAKRVKGLIDPRSLMDDKLSSKATENIVNNMSDLDSKNVNFKSLPDLSEETTAERFQIPVKKLIPKNNFTQGELKNTMSNLQEIFEDFVKIFPKGAVTNKAVTQALYGTSTGLPTNVLTSFYKKGNRIDTASGLPIYELQPITIEKFRQELGILPDGTLPDKVFVQSTQAQTAKGLAIMFGKLVTNTVVRQQLTPTAGSSQQIADIGAGKSELMLSQSLADQMYGRNYDGFKNGYETFEKLNDPKDIKKIYYQSYGKLDIQNEDLILEQMEKSAKAWEKSNKKITLGKYIYEETLGRTFKRTFQGILGLKPRSLDFRSEEQIKSARESFKLLINKIGVDSSLKYVGPTVKKAYGLRAGGFKLDLETGGLEVVDGDLKYFLIGGRLDFFKNFFDDALYKPKSKFATIDGVETKLPTVFDQKYTSKFAKEQFDRIRQAENQREGFRQIVNVLKDLYENQEISANDLGMILMTFNSNVDALVRTAAIPDLQIKNLDASKTEDYVYEHVKPARQVIQEVLGLYILNKDGNNTTFDEIMEDFRVAIIPKTYDKIISKYFKSHLPKDANNKGIKAKIVDGKYLAARYNDKRVVEEIEKAGLPPLEIIEVKKSEIKLSEGVDRSTQFNKIIEQVKGTSAEDTFSSSLAKLKGANIGKFKFFVPPSAEDFMGLMYSFLGKGEVGEKQKDFFEENLNLPYKRGIAELESAKQRVQEDYKKLRNNYKDIASKLGKKMPNSEYTFDQGIRIFLWRRAGFDLEKIGLSMREVTSASSVITQDQRLIQFAFGVAKIANQEAGYVNPTDYWLVETIASDLNNVSEKVGRKKFLSEFIENKNEIFSSENLNKIEALYGTNFREALIDILTRMETGTNRIASRFSNDRYVNTFANWINNSVGAIMFFNTRSAILQTISSVNYINWSDNNLLAAGKAFANQKQYWQDFTTIIMSDKLKQRRKGLTTDVQAAEISNSVATSKNKVKSALNYLLKKGFLPTQAADAFAIASGGATFYRNRANTYMKKDGLTKEEAEKRAFEDFSQLTDASQQSADPSMISQQQSGPLGRLVLAFQNTPMQYNRLIKKAALDLANNRGNAVENISKIVYYTFVQNLIFTSIQNALFAVAFNNEDEDDELIKKSYRVANNMLDTILRGTGIGGAVIATIKNTIIEFYKQENKGFFKDHVYTGIALFNVSPPVGSKLSRAYRGYTSQTIFDKDVIDVKGFSYDSPIYRVYGNYISAATNIPVDRVVNKLHNIIEATNSQHESWQRLAMLAGWPAWQLNIENKEHELIKARAKEVRKQTGIDKRKKTALVKRLNKKVWFNKMTKAEQDKYINDMLKQK
tara:strand:- start:1816 stop:9087 length:7272 start_codon:yes stop_codon:yes gene_type:complete